MSRVSLTSELGQLLIPEYVSKLFDKLRRKTSLPPMRFHGLRHEHSTVANACDTYSHLIGDAARVTASRASSLVPRTPSAQQMHNPEASSETTKAPAPLC